MKTPRGASPTKKGDAAITFKKKHATLAQALDFVKSGAGGGIWKKVCCGKIEKLCSANADNAKLLLVKNNQLATHPCAKTSAALADIARCMQRLSLSRGQAPSPLQRTPSPAKPTAVEVLSARIDKLSAEMESRDNSATEARRQNMRKMAAIVRESQPHKDQVVLLSQQMTHLATMVHNIVDADGVEHDAGSEQAAASAGKSSRAAGKATTESAKSGHKAKIAKSAKSAKSSHEAKVAKAAGGVIRETLKAQISDFDAQVSDFLGKGTADKQTVNAVKSKRKTVDSLKEQVWDDGVSDTQLAAMSDELVKACDLSCIQMSPVGAKTSAASRGNSKGPKVPKAVCNKLKVLQKHIYEER